MTKWLEDAVHQEKMPPLTSRSTGLEGWRDNQHLCRPVVGGILLVQAPTLDAHTLFRGAPMSILYAATTLAARISDGSYPGWSRSNIALFDAAVDYTDHPQDAKVGLREVLALRQPDIVAIGSTSYAFRWALDLARAAKQERPNSVLVIGGPHEDEAGGLGPGGSIAEYGDIFDFSVQGDGEYALEYLVRLLFSSGFDITSTKQKLSIGGLPQDIEGACAITFRHDGESLMRGAGANFKPGLRRRGPNPINLDKLEMPPRWLLGPESEHHFSVFRRKDGSLKRVAQVTLSRGCSYACSFCTERGALISRQPDRCLEELQYLRNNGYEAIFFDDSTFHLYPHLHDFLEVLSAEREVLGLEYGCLTRVDSILENEKHTPLRFFEDAGFTYFYIGIEHLNDAVLRDFRKGYSTAQIRECFELLKEAQQLKVGVSLLFGSQSETVESRYDSLRFVAEDERIILVSLSLLAYHPAAGFDKAHARALRFDNDVPHDNRPWYLFEEGTWYHPPNIDLTFASQIHLLIHEVDQATGGRLVPKLQRAKQLLGPSELAINGNVISFANAKKTIYR